MMVFWMKYRLISGAATWIMLACFFLVTANELETEQRLSAIGVQLQLGACPRITEIDPIYAFRQTYSDQYVSKSN